MKPAVGSDAQRRPQQPTKRPNTEIPSRSVYRFPVSVNSFQLLQDSQSVVSTSSSQIQDRLIDPRTTRLAKLQVARGIDEQGTVGNLSSEGIFDTVPPVRDAQGILTSGNVDQPVASRIRSRFFPHSLSLSAPDILKSQSGGNVQNLLGTGVAVDNAMYYHDVNDVTCILDKCNKRISVAGQEWSAGRPGNRPIGARDAARNSETCLGLYATRETV